MHIKAILALTVLSCTPCLAADPRLEVTVNLAAPKIARGDCQIIRVNVKNLLFDAPVKLDESLNVSLAGPSVQINSDTTDWVHVWAAGQHIAKGDGEATIPARGSASVLMAFARRMGPDDLPLFDKPERYELRARVIAKGIHFLSDNVAFEVSHDVIDWTDKDLAKQYVDLVRFPVPAEFDIEKRDTLATTLPKESLMHKLCTLGAEGAQFAGSPQERRAAWAKSKGDAPPLVADLVSIGVVRRF